MEIAWVPSEKLQTKGKLGLCCSPGSKTNQRDSDLVELKNLGVTHILSVQEAEEMKKMIPVETMDERRDAVIKAGMKFTHEPIIDCSAPTLEHAQKIVKLLREELANGENVVVHCWGGRGRAGTVTSCTLVSYGHSPENAISLIREIRPGAVEVSEQVDLVSKFTLESL